MSEPGNENTTICISLQNEVAKSLSETASFYGVGVQEYVAAICGFLADRRRNIKAPGKEELLKSLLFSEGEVASLKFQNYTM
ncbi:MAG: hypothetical protein QXI37_03100, partial [Thermoprotei archaeon]